MELIRIKIPVAPGVYFSDAGNFANESGIRWNRHLPEVMNWRIRMNLLLLSMN
jgi:hypothetical protein